MIDLLKKFKNKKVIITGHTGFKGSWLSLWLDSLGAKVTGISNGVPTNPSNFNLNRLNKKINHLMIDVRNEKKLYQVVNKIKPDYIFHLAAQSLVKKSYLNPVETFEINSMGTLNLLECLRRYKPKKKCSIVIITSDKSYKNLEIKRGYKENDILGGHDPYSASKASAELIIQCYIKSFLQRKKNIFISIARAGNVIGGGDWSDDRLFPDCVRAIKSKKTLNIRFANSTRPWQHVLEVLFGYMILAKKQKQNKHANGQAYNFGPNNKKSIKVIDMVKNFKKNWNLLSYKIIKSRNKEFESGLLKLNSNKSLKNLKWRCLLSTEETISMLVEWYKFYFQNQKQSMYNFSISQIKSFEMVIRNKL